MKKRPIIKNESHVFFRKHPLGFTILQKKSESFESDDQYVFFHGQQLLPSSALERHGNKLKSKKLRGLKKNEEKGRVILKNLELISEALLVNLDTKNATLN